MITGAYTDMHKSEWDKLPILSQRIRFLLERDGITLNQLGEKTGIRPSVMKSYIDKRVDIGADNLQKLADAFDVSTDFLLGRTKVQTVKVSIKSAMKTTGLSENAVYFLESLKNDNGLSSKDVLAAINLLLSDENFDFWSRIFAYFDAPYNTFTIRLTTREEEFLAEDVLQVLLNANNQDLRRIRDEWKKKQEVKDNGKH